MSKPDNAPSLQSERAMTEIPAPPMDVDEMRQILTDLVASGWPRRRETDALAWLASALPALLAAQAENDSLHVIIDGLEDENDRLVTALEQIEDPARGEDDTDTLFGCINTAYTALAASRLPCSESTDTNG